MQIDMKKFALISMSDKWSEDERQRYDLLSQDNALNYHQSLTKKDFSLNQWQWSIYYLIFELNTVGFIVLVGNYTGSNRKRLAKMVELSNEFANGTLNDLQSE